MEKVICPSCDKEVEKKDKCSACGFNFDAFEDFDRLMNAREKRQAKKEEERKKKEAEETAKLKKAGFFDVLRGNK